MVNLDTETELFLGLELEISSDDPCENPFHVKQPWFHEGKAAWRVHAKCSACPRDFVYLICDKYYRVLSYEDHVVWCIECLGRTVSQDWIVSAERI